MNKNKIISTTLACSLLGVNIINVKAIDNPVEISVNENEGQEITTIEEVEKEGSEKVVISKPVITYENNQFSITKQGEDTEGAKLEYRINGGAWQSYTETFKIDVKDIVDNKVKVEASILVQDTRGDIVESIVEIKLAEITAINTTITQGDTFKELANVTAKDIDGTDITKNIEVVKNEVKNDIPGKYTVVYQVKGSNNYTVTKEIEVTVKEKYIITINAVDKVIYLNDKFNALDGITAKDSKNQDLTKKITVKSTDVNTSKVGTYKAVYEVLDEDNQPTIKEIKVTVKDKDTTTNSQTNKPQTSDSSILYYAGFGLLSLIGLVTINKKYKNKSEK